MSCGLSLTKAGSRNRRTRAITVSNIKIIEDIRRQRFLVFLGLVEANAGVNLVKNEGFDVVDTDCSPCSMLIET